MGDFLNLIGKEQLSAYDRLKDERNAAKDRADHEYQFVRKYLQARRAPKEAFLELAEQHRLEVEQVLRSFQEKVHALIQDLAPKS